MLVNRIASAILSALGALSATAHIPPALSLSFNQPPFLRLQPTTQHLRNRLDSRIFRSAESEMEVESHEEMRILGICGGIGSGKSTVCKLMVDSLGCIDRIDADILAHGVYEPGSQSLKDIVSEFGQDILCETQSSTDNAEIDRKKLGAIVFSDNKAMSRLEQIVWPHVRTKIEDRISQIKQQHSSNSSDPKPNNIIIVEAALLLETDWHDLLDGLWVVQSSPSVAVQRLIDNRGLTEEEALTRINAQQQRRGIGDGDDEKFRQDIEKGLVTKVITNDGMLIDLQNALEAALHDPASFKRQPSD